MWGEETGWEVLGEEGSESLEYSRRVEFRRSLLFGSLPSWLEMGGMEGVFVVGGDENCDVMIGGNLAQGGETKRSHLKAISLHRN